MDQLFASSLQPVAVDHSSRDSLRKRAVSNLQRGDLEDAIRSGLSSYRITKTLAALAPVPNQRYPHDLLPECLLLGKAYAQSLQTERASFYLQQATAIADESPYPEVSTNAALYSIIAELYMLLGLSDEAEKMYNKYQSAVEIGYGMEHLATSDCYNLLGAFYTHHGRYEPAISYCNRALDIRVKLLGPRHQST
jgi:tetratricopeptide (TPR) repeat protein